MSTQRNKKRVQERRYKLQHKTNTKDYREKQQQKASTEKLSPLGIKQITKLKTEASEEIRNKRELYYTQKKSRNDNWKIIDLLATSPH